MSSPLCAILVDIDGTQIDSNDAHTHAWIETLARHSHKSPNEAIRPLIGKGGDKLLSEVPGDAIAEADGDAWSDERSRWFMSNELHKLQPTRGA